MSHKTYPIKFKYLGYDFTFRCKEEKPSKEALTIFLRSLIFDYEKIGSRCFRIRFKRPYYLDSLTGIGRHAKYGPFFIRFFIPKHSPELIEINEIFSTRRVTTDLFCQKTLPLFESALERKKKKDSVVKKMKKAFPPSETVK